MTVTDTVDEDENPLESVTFAVYVNVPALFMMSVVHDDDVPEYEKPLPDTEYVDIVAPYWALADILKLTDDLPFRHSPEKGFTVAATADTPVGLDDASVIVKVLST